MTIETNGTLAPGGIVADLASISPKLSNSESDPAAFPIEAARQTEAHRWRPAVLREWLDRYECQLKFVVSGEPDILEIRELLRRVGRPVPPERILLMPQAADRASLRRRASNVAELCLKHGYRFGHRLQVELSFR